jgi:uncharacterized protein (DUF433 family)
MSMDRNYFNTGIYTVRDASKLTRVSAGRIRRWLRGYKFRHKSKSYRSEALWHGQWEPIDNTLALGFLDLIEIRFVDAFLKAGVSWKTLRLARQRAAEMFNASHPFCTHRFVTDGREIFAELQRETGETALIDIIERQRVFADFLRPFIKDLEFAHERGVVRWWPIADRKTIVLDPERNFGRPIIAKNGVPTDVLAKAAHATASVSEVARWFELREVEIQDAVEFEQRLAA